MESETGAIVQQVMVRDQIVDFIDTACDNCQSRQMEVLFTGRDRFLHLPGQFRLVKCRRCGLIRQNPMPSASGIDAYYPPAYEPYSPSIVRERSILRRWDRRYGMVKRRRQVEQFEKTGRILDIGCATGNFLLEMKQTGRWQVVGIEPNAHAAAYAVNEQGLDVRVGTVANLEFPDASFDVITLWNVLEHLTTPIADLRRIERWLRPGGRLVFSLPNLESFEVSVFGEKWFGWELPRHLYFFPRHTLSVILGDLGICLETDVCLTGTQLSFALSFRHVYDGEAAHPLWHTAMAWFLESAIGRMFFVPVFYLVGVLRQGMIVTYVARKHG